MTSLLSFFSASAKAVSQGAQALEQELEGVRRNMRALNARNELRYYAEPALMMLELAFRSAEQDHDDRRKRAKMDPASRRLMEESRAQFEAAMAPQLADWAAKTAELAVSNRALFAQGLPQPESFADPEQERISREAYAEIHDDFLRELDGYRERLRREPHLRPDVERHLKELGAEALAPLVF